VPVDSSKLEKKKRKKSSALSNLTDPEYFNVENVIEFIMFMQVLCPKPKRSNI